MSLLKVEPRWYAVQTRSNFERTVCVELTAQGTDHYCPAFTENHRWADRQKTIQRPVFPGYVFVRFLDDSATRLKIQKTTGAVRLIGFGREITPVPDEEIDSIRLMMSNRKSCFSHPFLRKGDLVRVCRGPLRDLQGFLVRVKGGARLVLSVGLLSQSIATEVELDDVEIISHPAASTKRVQCTQI